MKILNIRFQNLNSLKGTWHIDFTDPAYAENSLFAITGPTGAGKSTLLDAICLALYGQTPRLAKITKSSNEIMSRHTGVCFAEVSFTTTKGSFRCHWSQHRSRQKANGELQQPKHEIADGVSNTILESRIRNVGTKVEEVTGMDFERFTRSTLLAQGGFAAFLQASADKRAPILEQITGTEIYSLLSIKVHELRADEQKKMEELEQHLSHINLLPPEEEKELQNLIIVKEKEADHLKTTLTDLRIQQTWMENIAKLSVEKDAYLQQIETLAKDRKKHSHQLNKLQPALAAKKIEPIYREQESLLHRQRQASKEIEDLKTRLQTLEEQKQSRALKTSEAITTVQQTGTTRENGLKLIAGVQELDHTIRTTEEKLQEQSDSLAAETRQLNEEDVTIKNLQQNLAQAYSRKTILDNFFKKQAGDEQLIEEFNVLKLMINSFRDISVQNINIIRERKKAAQETACRKKEVTKLTKDQTILQIKIAAAGKLFTNLQREISNLLEDKTEGELQQTLFRTQNRQRSLQELILLLEEHTAKTKLSENYQKQVFAIREQAGRIEQKLYSITTKQVGKQQEIDLLDKNLRLLARIQTLEEDRNQLQDNTPCPLCGSTNHPYNDGTIPEISKEETELKCAKTELKDLEKERAKLTRQGIIAGEQQSNLARQIEETEQNLRSIQKGAGQLLSDLALPPLEKLTPDQLPTEQQQLMKKQQYLQNACERLEKLNKERNTAEKDKDTLTTAIQKLDKKLAETNHQESSAENNEQRLSEQEANLSQELTTISTELFDKLDSYGIKRSTAVMLTRVLEKLDQRVGNWKQKKEEEIRNTAHLLSLNSDLNHRKQLYETLTKQTAAREQSCKLIQKSLDDLRKERAKLFGSKKTDKESERLGQAVKDVRNTLELLQREHEKLKREIIASRTLQNRLETEQTTRRHTIKEQTELLTLSIKNSIFPTLEDLLAARLTTRELEELQNFHDTLQKKESELQTLYKEKTLSLQVEGKKQLCKETPEELKKQIKEQEKQLETMQAHTITASEQLKRNDSDKSRSAAQLAVIESQKKIVGRWNRLHMLIGSADGKKFRNFAQGLTFEMMIHHANTHLNRMNDRYILVRDKNQPLDLNVIDTYQADEIRSTKNLSGGESFLVSLALALGLSRMASQNVRVDSLFLDEGFGTLDEEALESALETLAQLREDNKLIGIISHVGALKERIPLQIEIIPESRGTSSIKGPGVTLMDS